MRTFYAINKFDFTYFKMLEKSRSNISCFLPKPELMYATLPRHISVTWESSDLSLSPSPSSPLPPPLSLYMDRCRTESAEA